MRRFSDDERTLLLQRISRDEDPESPDAQWETVRLMQRYCQDVGVRLGASLQEENKGLRGAFKMLEKNNQKLQEKIEGMLAPPWFPAIYLGPALTEGRSAAVVFDGHGRRVVDVHSDIDSDDLMMGDQVFLGETRNLLIAKARIHLDESGETGEFKRYVARNRIVLQSHDEEVVVRASAKLMADQLSVGDLIRWDRRLWIAFEKIGRSTGAENFLEDTPVETFAHIGGLDEQIGILQRSILLHRESSDLVQKYHLRRLGGMVMAGKPGNGKTLMARALANWMASLSPEKKARFMNIKPAGLHSMWYGKSEEQYREAFEVARRFGDQDPTIPVVMFFDEIDACGTSRGTSLGHANDRVLSAFLAELDGLSRRGNILVVGATNRIDALDSALLRPGRLGDCILQIPRPGRQAAREIFSRHLHATVPFAQETGEAQTDGEDTNRETVIEAALSRLYAGNDANRVATLHFRNGETRQVHARDLISGASIAKIVREASERACLRELDDGSSGLRQDDFWAAIDDEVEQAASVLTTGNCRNYLEDLPQDVDVIRVELVKRATAQMYRVLRVA